MGLYYQFHRHLRLKSLMLGTSSEELQRMNDGLFVKYSQDIVK